MYWLLLSMYPENFGFGLGIFVIRATFVKGSSDHCLEYQVIVCRPSEEGDRITNL